MSEATEQPPEEQPSDRIELNAEEDADQDRAIAWVVERWETDGKAPVCPICRTETAKWHVGGPISLPAFRREFGEVILPAFTFTCSECGHVLFLNALRPKNLLVDDVNDSESNDSAAADTDAPPAEERGEGTAE